MNGRNAPVKRGQRKRSKDTIAARWLSVVTVQDPDTRGDVVVELFKDPISGGIFGIDSSFLEQGDAVIINPFDAGVRLDCSEAENREEELMTTDTVCESAQNSHNTSRKFFRSNFFRVEDPGLFDRDFCHKYGLHSLQLPGGLVGFEGNEGEGLADYPRQLGNVGMGEPQAYTSSARLRVQGDAFVWPAFFADLASHLAPGWCAVVNEVWYGTRGDDEGGATGVSVALNNRGEWCMLSLDALIALAQRDLKGEITNVEG